MHEKDESGAVEVGNLTLTSPPETRTRIVSHNWKTIRNAMHVAKNEHMSSVDDYVSCCAPVPGSSLTFQQGHEIRHSQDHPQEKRTKTKADIKTVRLDGLKEGGGRATFLVDDKRKDELKALADDLAIVCPLVDGRMRDMADDQQ
jgi:hypothetical protein